LEWDPKRQRGLREGRNPKGLGGIRELAFLGDLYVYRVFPLSQNAHLPGLKSGWGNPIRLVELLAAGPGGGLAPGAEQAGYMALAMTFHIDSLRPR
jgi:hypothetical protein